MYGAARDDESTGLVRYLDQQLGAIRASIIGLTEEQVRMRPCRSTLSIGGLLKHVTYGMRGGLERLAAPEVGERVVDEDGFAQYQSSFELDDAETGAATLAAFDAARVEYLAAVAATDPAAPIMEPPSPWYGIFEPREANARYYLVHQIEEMARHAGHADIIREQIDGTQVPAIVLTAEGMEAGEFFQPYVPAPGTVGAA